MAICPNCGTENPDESRVCSECNQPLTAGDTVRCPMCSRPNPPNVAVCEHCGARLRPMTAEDLEDIAPTPTPPRPVAPAPPPPRPAAPAPPSEARAAPPSAPAEDDTDRGLRSIFSTPAEERGERDRAPDEGAETPSWLSRLEDEGEEQMPTRQPPPAEEAEPDWLGSPRAEPEPTEAPSWLRGPSPTRDEGPPRPEEPSARPPAGEEEPSPAETPSWLGGAPEGGEDDIPDWLRDLPSEAPAAEGEGEEILAWLQDVPVEPAGTEGAMPEWLQEAQQMAPPPPLDVAPPPSAAVPPAEPPPREPPAEERMPEPEPPPVAEDISALLGEMPLEESVPSWLEDIGAPKEEEKPPGEPMPAFDVSALEGETGAPDWPEEALPQVPEPVEGGLTGDEKEFLDLLAELEAEEPGPAEEQPAVTIEQAELPEWLRSQRPEEIEKILPTERVQAPGTIESELAAAEPRSIEDLRFEAILGETGAEEGRPELAGVLRDVRGVLKPEPIFVAPEPERMIEDVVVTEEQAKRIETVVSALAAEHEGAVLGDLRRRAFPIERWLATLFVLAAIIVPIVVGFQPMPAPQTRSLAVREVIEVIDALPEESRVLMAFEYEPDTAGELDVAVEAVVAHLMSRDANFYAISTRTTGRDVAQRVLTAATDNQADYAYGERWFNLGYLAGRPVGVRRLALGAYIGGESPLIRDYRGNPTGLAPDDLYEFDAVIVFAARPEEVRDWIEQIGRVTDMPMVAVVSASAAPVVYPYAQSGQLAGVINGFSDAITYSVSMQAFSPELATRWNAQALASLVAAALIIGGVLIHGLIALRRRSERTQ